MAQALSATLLSWLVIETVGISKVEIDLSRRTRIARSRVKQWSTEHHLEIQELSHAS